MSDKNIASGYLLVSQDLTRLMQDVPATPWPLSCKRKITDYFNEAINFSHLESYILELKGPVEEAALREWNSYLQNYHSCSTRIFPFLEVRRERLLYKDEKGLMQIKFFRHHYKKIHEWLAQSKATLR